jgi:regulation of enolase protein 1 (concanavalin A-like superfamily)
MLSDPQHLPEISGEFTRFVDVMRAYQNIYDVAGWN